MTAAQGLLQVSLLSNLRNQPVNADDRVFLVGKNSIDDGLGGLYRWDAASVASEDATFMNIIVSNLTVTGRWLRVFQKAQTLPQGVLVLNGGVKTLYVPSTIGAGGKTTIYLTYDGTSTGTPIFSEIWKNDSKAQTNVSGPSNSISSYIQVTPDQTSYKSTTHGYFSPNAVTVTLGLLYSPFAAAASGTPVLFEIVGV